MKIPQAQQTLLNHLCNPKHLDALCFLTVSVYFLANGHLGDAAIVDKLSVKINTVSRAAVSKRTSLNGSRKRKRGKKCGKESLTTSASLFSLASAIQVQKTLSLISEISSPSPIPKKNKSRKSDPKTNRLTDEREIPCFPFNPPQERGALSSSNNHTSTILESPAGSPIAISNYDDLMMNGNEYHVLQNETLQQQSQVHPLEESRDGMMLDAERPTEPSEAADTVMNASHSNELDNETLQQRPEVDAERPTEPSEAADTVMNASHNNELDNETLQQRPEVDAERPTEPSEGANAVLDTYCNDSESHNENNGNPSRNFEDNDFAQGSMGPRGSSFRSCSLSPDNTNLHDQLPSNQSSPRNVPLYQTPHLDQLCWDELETDMQRFVNILRSGKKPFAPVVIDSDWQEACFNDSKLDCKKGLMGLYSRIQKVILYTKFEAEIAVR